MDDNICNNTPDASPRKRTIAGYFFWWAGLKFSKPAIMIDQQIDLLLSCGMEIPDRDYARHYLTPLNYYRFEIYWLPLESGHTSHIFTPGTRFDDAMKGCW